jgi:hypothetical protein
LKDKLLAWLSVLKQNNLAKDFNANHQRKLLFLREAILTGVRISGEDMDRIFFIDMLARLLLVQACFEELQSDYFNDHYENPIPQQSIDSFDNSIHFGNVDHECTDIVDVKKFTEYDLVFRNGAELPRHCVTEDLKPDGSAEE